MMPAPRTIDSVVLELEGLEGLAGTWNWDATYTVNEKSTMPANS